MEADRGGWGEGGTTLGIFGAGAVIRGPGPGTRGPLDIFFWTTMLFGDFVI